MDAGLRPDEYAAYSVVFEMRTITLTEMAEQLAMPLTTVAEYVRAMTERGHLRRKQHPTDQRARLLTLSPAGLRAHRQASRAFERAHRALLRSSLRWTRTAHARCCSGSRAAPTARSVRSRPAVSGS